MAQHNELGKQGENLAETYLLKEGYSILHRNWRHAREEIDIIAFKNNTVHIVEVKLRTSKTFGFPEVHVNKKKFNLLKAAAEEFLFQNPEYKLIQFNILSINIVNDTEIEYFLIQDVFL
jgi:putative endonuclease